ncbi:MAG: helix-turn-helix domain-containing protein [Pseudomonadota bacterium]|nr:helix-turn-helix domain-containing protein [Pseudomonadota bacterium]
MQEVSTRLGYRNPANFTRSFRRWTGRSPTEWRDESWQCPDCAVREKPGFVAVA